MMIPTKNILNKLTAAAKQVDLDVNLREYYSRKPALPSRSARNSQITVTTPKASRASTTASVNSRPSRPPVSPKLANLAQRSLTPPPSSRTPRAASPTVASIARQADGSAKLHARIRELEKQNAQLESTVLYHLRTMETTQRESEALHLFVRQTKTLVSVSDRQVHLSEVLSDLASLLTECGCQELAASVHRRVIPTSPSSVRPASASASVSGSVSLAPPEASQAGDLLHSISEEPRLVVPKPTRPVRTPEVSGFSGGRSSEAPEKRVQDIMDLIMNRN